MPPLREVIAKFDLGARKALGENFLLDLNLTGRIARSAGDLSGVTVIESGPGPGGLTRALLNSDAAAVVAVFRFKVGVLTVIGGCAAAGLLLHLIS